MSFQRYAINIPENLTDGTNLVLNITLDTKEIEGGREELILKPSGNYEIETYRHTGKLQIFKKYALKEENKTTQPNANASVHSSQDPLQRVLSTVMNTLLNGKDILKLFEKETWHFLEKLLIDEWINKAGQLLPSQKKFEITFFRGIDLSSLQLWEKKRMTGFNMTWHYEDKDGNRVNISPEPTQYSKQNKFYVEWVNTVHQALKHLGEEKIWEIIKEVRKQYVEEWYERVAEKEKRLPSIKFWGLDWAAIIVSVKRFHNRAYNLEGDVNFHKMVSRKLFGVSMMETFRNKTEMEFEISNHTLSENELTDDQLLKSSTMFLYLFSKPRSKELSFVKVWKKFYADLFVNFPPSIILQNLANIIKPELKSRRNKESVAEILFSKLSNYFKFEYGKLDFLLSTKEDVLDRINRIQFQSLKQKIIKSLENNVQNYIDTGYLRKST